MENKPQKVGESHLSLSIMVNQIAIEPTVAGPSNSKLRNLLYNVHDFNHTDEESRRQEEFGQNYGSDRPSSNSLLSLFGNLAIRESKKGKAKLGQLVKNKNRVKSSSIINPRPTVFDSWMTRAGVEKKDKCIQIDVPEQTLAEINEEIAHFLARPQMNSEKPSAVDPSRVNGFTKDVAVEAPDRNLYSSDQLIYFRCGDMVYFGWSYPTLDGKIGNMPRIPRGIPIDELRVEKPRRTHAPV